MKKLTLFLKKLFGFNKEYFFIDDTLIGFDRVISSTITFNINGKVVEVTTDKNGKIIKRTDYENKI
jgi:hypothetical protein